MEKAENVDQYIEQHPGWSNELSQLRKFFLSYDLEETIKWGAPVYTLKSKNLFGLAAFKNHYALWLFQGALLEKNTALLVNAQDEKTDAMRQIRFDETSQHDLKELTKYVEETLNLVKQGKKIVPAKKELIHADAIKAKMEEDSNFDKAFNSLTPGKQREYSDYISQAKREETRQSRMEKIRPLILAGKGLNDKYK